MVQLGLDARSASPSTAKSRPSDPLRAVNMKKSLHILEEERKGSWSKDTTSAALELKQLTACPPLTPEKLLPNGTLGKLRRWQTLDLAAFCPIKSTRASCK